MVKKTDKVDKDEILKSFQENMRKLSQEELLDVVGYSFMRIAELEMLYMVLIDKKIIDKEDFEKYIPMFEKKVLKKFDILSKRKPFEI
jgi:hypothetical protein